MQGARAVGLVLLIVTLFLGWRAISARSQPQVVYQQPPGSGQVTTSLSNPSYPANQSAAQQSSSSQSASQQVSNPVTSGQVARSGGIQSVSLSDGERGETGKGQTHSYKISLRDGEAIAGQSFGFGNGIEDQKTSCRAWLISGPFSGKVTVTDGEYFIFSGINLTGAQQEDLLAQVAQKQRAQYGDCQGRQYVDKLGG